jgi:hypothetical protein
MQAFIASKYLCMCGHLRSKTILIHVWLKNYALYNRLLYTQHYNILMSFKITWAGLYIEEEMGLYQHDYFVIMFLPGDGC